MNNISKILINLFVLTILVQTFSCSSRPKSYFGDKQIALPDSAKVKAVIAVSQGNVKEKLSAVLFAVPNEKYRLELSGTLGLSAASILWKRDGWRIVFSQNERYMEGEGDCVFIPIYGGVDIHKFSLLFFGQKINSLNCDNSKQPSNLALEYSDNSVLAFFGKDSLKLEIKNIDKKAEWKSGVWNLNVPENYVRLTGYLK
ncbi:MAG: hypothetical protein LBC87_03705 [Fibromonadaceae bacterium]|jgi:hypothetical protein|nr:hypothetical protein [Fibromonadaceae bacterium]